MQYRFCLLLLILPFCVHAQWRGLQFQRFDSRSGLNSDDIQAICEDRKGYMYFAGFQQLIRYDGHVFEDFTHDPYDSTSLSPGQISSMILGKDGKIYMTMRRSGFEIFDPETATFRHFRPDVPSNQTGPLIQDEEGLIWIGAISDILLRFDPKSEQFTTFQSNHPDIPKATNGSITGIVQDRTDPSTLWLTLFGYANPDFPSNTAYNIVKFNKSDGSFTPQPGSGNVLLQDTAGRLICGSWETGLWRYDPQTQQCGQVLFNDLTDPSIHTQNCVFDILGVDDQYWIASRKAIIASDGTSATSVVYADKTIDAIRTFFTDSRQNIWVGTSNGILVLHPGYQLIDAFSLDAFGPHDRIYPGRLAYAPKEQVIYLVNRNEPRIYRIPLNKQQEADYLELDQRAYAVAIDGAGRLLVAKDNSLYHCTYGTGALHKIHLTPETRIPWLWSMSVDQNGIVTANGKDFIWIDKSERTHTATFNDEVHSRYVITRDGRAILSGGNDICFIDLSTEKLMHISNLTEGHLIQDLNGDYWLGTINDLGKYRLEGDSLVPIRYYSAKDGLVNFTASHLHLDYQGRIWILSNSGMSVIDPETESTRNFSLLEGLPSSTMDAVQCLNLDDGRICTVNGNGIIAFHPDSLWNSATDDNVRVLLKDLRVNGEGYRLPASDETIPLASSQNTLDIQFQGLSFPTDRHVSYSYMVRGIHDHWNPLGKNNSVTLSGIPPGNYTFMVKAATPETDAPETSLHFSIATPLIRRAWFIALCAILIIALVALIYRDRISRIRRAEAEKTRIHKEMAELELQALRAQMNPHFMFNSLNSIKNYILKNEPAKAAEYLSNFSHLIRLILQNSRETSVSLQDELDTLLLYVDLEKMRFRDGFDFTCQVDDSIDISQVQVPPMIVQPFLENAIWHGLLHKEHDRHLGISVSRFNGMVTCEIDDNGIGREKAAEIKSKSATRYKSMGMGITSDRIALLNSMSALGITVEIIDKFTDTGLPDGTRVKIHIPHARNSH